MDLRKLKEVIRHAEFYHILSRYERTGEFDYTIYFNEEDSFSNGHKAMLFIDGLVEREKLTRYTKPYRVGFGWEIGGK